MSFELPITRKLKLLRGEDPGVPEWYREWEAKIEKQKLEIEEGLREALRGTVGGLGPVEHVGRIPVRQELTVLPPDPPGQREIGFYVYETIGIGVVNPGVSHLFITDD